jgi:hypothetical protein
LGRGVVAEEEFEGGLYSCFGGVGFLVGDLFVDDFEYDLSMALLLHCGMLWEYIINRNIFWALLRIRDMLKLLIILRCIDDHCASFYGL